MVGFIWLHSGAACADVPIGKRECHVGSMLVLAQILALNSTGFQSEMTSTTAEAPLVWPMLRDILEVGMRLVDLIVW